MTPEAIRIMRAVTMAAAGLFAALGLRSEIIDRVVAIVGTEAVTLSDVTAELGLEAMLAHTEARSIAEAGEAILGRLIDRRLIAQDMTATPFLLPWDEEVEEGVSALRGQRYLGNRDFGAALAHYGLTESDCRSFIQQQIAFERYVSFRFKTGLSANAAEIAAYYGNEYLPGILQRGERPQPVEQVAERISEVLIERRATELLDQRLIELRSITRVKPMLNPPGESRP